MYLYNQKAKYKIYFCFTFFIYSKMGGCCSTEDDHQTPTQVSNEIKAVVPNDAHGLFINIKTIFLT